MSVADSFFTQFDRQDKPHSNKRWVSPFAQSHIQRLGAFLEDNFTLHPLKMVSVPQLREAVDAHFGEAVVPPKAIRQALSHTFGESVILDNQQLIYESHRWVPGLAFKNKPSTSTPVAWNMKPEFLRLRGEKEPESARYFKKFYCVEDPFAILPLERLLAAMGYNPPDLTSAFTIVKDRVHGVRLKSDNGCDFLSKDLATPELFFKTFCLQKPNWAIRSQDILGAYLEWRKTFPGGGSAVLNLEVFTPNYDQSWIHGYKFTKQGLNFWRRFAAQQKSPTKEENLYMKLR